MRTRGRNLLWYARMVLLGTWFLVLSVALLPVSALRWRNTANNRLFVMLLVPVARRILGMRVRWRGADRTLAAPPSVFVMNHQAALDIVVNAELYPKRCVLIAKKSLGRIPVFGWILYLAGNLLLDRKDREHSMAKMSLADEAIRDRGLSVWIFPEGTRSLHRGLGPFKKGAFHLAVKNQVPVVPVAVSSYHRSLDFTRWRAGTVAIEVLAPIPTAGLTADDIPALMERTHAAMRAGVERLDAELAEARGEPVRAPASVPPPRRPAEARG